MSLDEYLKNEVEKGNISLDSDENKSLKKEKKNRKGIIAIVVALLLAGTIATLGFLHSCTRVFKKSDSDEDLDLDNSTSISSTKLRNRLSDLGKFKSKDKKDNSYKYGATTGNVDVNKIVEGNAGNIYVNSEAAKNASNVGKVVVDDKNGTLIIKSDGTAKEKQEYYQIVDSKTGEVIEEGIIDEANQKYTPSGVAIPNGYAWDEVRKSIVPENEVGLYIVDPDGDLVLKSEYEKHLNSVNDRIGIVVSEETVYYDEPIAVVESDTEIVSSKPVTDHSNTTSTDTEKKSNDTTSKPSNNDTSSNINANSDVEVIDVKEETVYTKGTVNADGTYTIDGVTFASEYDYYEWLINPDDYGFGPDGIVRPISDMYTNDVSCQKVLR